jgi:hypothetical protein
MSGLPLHHVFSAFTRFNISPDRAATQPSYVHFLPFSCCAQSLTYRRAMVSAVRAGEATEEQ